MVRVIYHSTFPLKLIAGTLDILFPQPLHPPLCSHWHVRACFSPPIGNFWGDTIRSILLISIGGLSMIVGADSFSL
jgi:hypothetical protein